MADILISADSHVVEPHDLWTTRLPAAFRDEAPVFKPPRTGEGFQQHAGGTDPTQRVKEMEVDHVAAEILYPTLAMMMFGQKNAALQEACFRVYNDWLIDYCSVVGERVMGVAVLSAYDIEHAVAELERCHKAGLRGAMIWQTPDPALPFHSPHYDRLWAACQDMRAPVNLHVMTGHNYHAIPADRREPETPRRFSNLKVLDVANGLFDLVHYGVLERYPELKVMVVEDEIGWLPFFAQQWDYYYRRFGPDSLPITQPPSFYMQRQVFATFFNDAVGGHNLEWWGQDNCLWSNDYPHPNSTWPNSLEVIERDLGHLPADIRAKLTWQNVARLYDIRLPHVTEPC